MKFKIGMIAVLASVALPAAASGQMFTASNTQRLWNPATAPEQSRVAYVDGPDTPPGGIGSVQLSAGPGSNGLVRRVALRTAVPGELQLYNIGQLRYWTYTTGTGNSVPYLSLTLDDDEDLQYDDTIVYSPPAILRRTGTWQLWDARHGGLWYSVNYGGPNHFFSFDDYVRDHPRARLLNHSQDVGALAVTVGDARNTEPAVGYVDNVFVGRNGILGQLAFNFERDPNNPFF